MQPSAMAKLGTVTEPGAKGACPLTAGVWLMQEASQSSVHR